MFRRKKPKPIKKIDFELFQFEEERIFFGLDL